MKRVTAYTSVAFAASLGTAAGLVIGMGHAVRRRMAEAEAEQQSSPFGPVQLWGYAARAAEDGEAEETLFADVRAMYQHYQDFHDGDLPGAWDIAAAFGISTPRAQELKRRFDNELGTGRAFGTDQEW